MVFEEVVTSVISTFPTDVSDKLLNLIFVLKALGIAAIIYVVYVVVTGFFNYRRMKKIDSLEKKADDIDKKVDLINKKLDKIMKKG
ncbi:MAG: hypothetical protein V1888_00715 [archaeon]